MFRLIVLSGCLSLLVGCGTKVGAEHPADPVASKRSASTPVTTPVVAARDAKGSVDPERLPSEILARCKDATVLIGDFENGKLNSTGSGVVLSDGKTVVTNRHVVVGEDDTPDPLKLVFFAGTDHTRIVQVKASAITVLTTHREKGKDDHDDDVAAIRLAAQIAPPLDIAKDTAAEETASAWSFGFPNGMDIRRGEDQIPSPTIHSVRIERVERKKGEVTVLQFGGSVTYGDSGGPVVTRTGEVLGIMQSLADGRSSIVYALPGKSIRTIVARAKSPNSVATSGSLATRFAADLGDPKLKPERVEEREPERPSDPGPIEGATSALAENDVDEATMDGLSPMMLTMLRNEPFARRGYIFKRAAIRSFFSNTDWYTPRTRDIGAVERRFTARERRNVNQISSYQKLSNKQW